ncbi:GNAT family N-acetyltransferase [Methylobacter psychrophilus]|uniref:GNAT family N-acetyltransferase n=1 Tax=Methylobacter psychrophilus TaxID=96941 RepID=UPI0021D4C5D0|nr:GNAT family N-acetyltransferase [Methylobacter psychrophilus]
MNLSIRRATFEDIYHINILISKSVLILQAQYYKKSEIETALELVSGVEKLIAVDSFRVAENENKIIGCGGWAIDISAPHKAEIRGFFVHPDFARKGVATYLLTYLPNARMNVCLKELRLYI